MASVAILEAAGLHTGNNELSATPNGALFKAEDVVIRGKNVIEPRRGQKPLVDAQLLGNPDEVFFYRDTILVNTEANTLDLITEPGGGSALDASYDATPSDRSAARMRGFEIQNNFYYMSSDGLMRLESPVAIPVEAGGPLCPDLTGYVSGSSGFMAADSLVAYRTVFSVLDANENEMLGPPSGRTIISSVGASNPSDVTLVIPTPAEPTTNMTLYLYRSTVEDADTTPDDELFLVYRHRLTAGEVSGLYVNYIDRTPDTFLSDPLYTNFNTGESISQANNPPPLSRDMALWDERAFYANTQQPQSVSLQLLGVGSGSGMRLGDSITFDGQRYVAWTTQGISPLDGGGGLTFRLMTELADPFQNIYYTAKSLVDMITFYNTNLSQPYFARYLSDDDSLPGLISILAKSVATPEFTVTADTYTFPVSTASRTSNVVTFTMAQQHGFEVGDSVNITTTGSVLNDVTPGNYVLTAAGALTFAFSCAGADFATTGTFSVYRAERSLSGYAAEAWNPALYPGLVASDNDRALQRLYYSKTNEPEAVPLVNFIDVGVKDKAILRIVPLRDRLFIFKEDGVYILSGDAPFFNVDLLDDSVKILAPDTAVAMSNNIYCLTNQGVVSVSELGAQVVSKAIENDLVQLFSPDTLSVLKTKSFGVAHEADRLYTVWLPKRAGTKVEYGFVLNISTGVWTRWNLERSCGRVNPDTNSLYMGVVDDLYITKERRTFTYADYVEGTVSVLADSFDPATKLLTFAEDISDIPVGSALQDPNTDMYFRVVGRPSATELELDKDTFTTGLFPFDVEISLPIPCEVRWANQDADAPNNLKTWSEAHVLFKVAGFKNGHFTFSTDTVPTPSEVEMDGAEAEVDPTQHWGEFDQIVQARVYVDSEHAMSGFMRPGIKINEAMGFWQLVGMTLTYEIGGTAVTF